MRTRSAVLTAAATALLLLPAAAHAAPTPGASYSGGLLPKSFTAGGDHTLMTATTAADGQNVRVVATLSLRCNRRPGAIQQLVANGRIGADGRLRLEAGTRNYVYATAGARPRGRAALDLGFEGPTASGTLRFTAKYKTRGRTVTCDETLPVSLRSAAPDPGTAGPPPAGAVLFGTGSAAYRGAPVPVGLKVSADGRRVDPTLVGVPLRCRSVDLTDYLLNTSPRITIGGDGTFRSRETFSLRFKGGGRTSTTFKLDGRFTAQGATGTYSASSVARTPGRKSVRCSSGEVTFSAVR